MRKFWFHLPLVFLIMACTPKQSEVAQSNASQPTLNGSAIVSISKIKPIVEILPEPENHAWWLRTRYLPTDTNIRGIAARNLNAAWCKVQELTSGAFPDGLFEKSFGSDENKFFISNPFTNLKRPHFWLLGLTRLVIDLNLGL